VTEIIWIIVIISISLGIWLATIERSMLILTPYILRHELEIRGTPQRAMWFAVSYENILQSVVFSKILCSLVTIYGFVMLVTSKTITVGSMVGGFLIAGLVLWLFTSIVAGAVAQSVPVETVSRSWYILRGVGVVGSISSGLIKVVGEIVRRLTGVNHRNHDGANGVEEQLLRSIEHSQREGGIPLESAEMLENVVDFGTTNVGEIMTPRTDIEGIELTNDLLEIQKFVLSTGRSRIPVFEENLDQILGILYVKDLIEFLGEGASGFELKSILRTSIVVPETKSVQELLTDFQKSEVHMAVVIDEYGGTAGLVTFEDVLEEIVGEIRDEHDDAASDEPILKRINEALVEVDGRYNLDDLNDELDLKLPKDEEYDTIAGFVLAKLGHVPKVGEVLESHGLRCTTIDATTTQIVRLSIEILPIDE